MDITKRAKIVDKVMTSIFYVIAGLFLLLLIAFAAYVIGNGFKDFTPKLLSFGKDGIGNQLFNTLYLVDRKSVV